MQRIFLGSARREALPFRGPHATPKTVQGRLDRHRRVGDDRFAVRRGVHLQPVRGEGERPARRGAARRRLLRAQAVPRRRLHALPDAAVLGRVRAQFGVGEDPTRTHVPGDRAQQQPRTRACRRARERRAHRQRLAHRCVARRARPGDRDRGQPQVADRGVDVVHVRARGLADQGRVRRGGLRLRARPGAGERHRHRNRRRPAQGHPTGCTASAVCRLSPRLRAGRQRPRAGRQVAPVGARRVESRCARRLERLPRWRRGAPACLRVVGQHDRIGQRARVLPAARATVRRHRLEQELAEQQSPRQHERARPGVVRQPGGVAVRQWRVGVRTGELGGARSGDAQSERAHPVSVRVLPHSTRS
jgi:hypothetical protein